MRAPSTSMLAWHRNRELMGYLGLSKVTRKSFSMAISSHRCIEAGKYRPFEHIAVSVSITVLGISSSL